mgnify:FL=1
MFSNDKNIETIGQLVEVTKHYIGLQTRYAKLDVMVKIVRLLTVATMAVLLSVLLMLSLIYLSFAAAFALGAVIGNGLAFCAVAGVYIVVLLLFVCFRKRWIERPLVKFLAAILLED